MPGAPESDPFVNPDQIGSGRIHGNPSLFELRDLVYGDDEHEGEFLPTEYEIAFRATDFPVDSLVHRIRTKRILVPEFQREYVWPRKHSERFIESLLLGLPVPAIFLAQDPSKKHLLVVDGHQRLAAIRAFYEGVLDGEPFSLDSVPSRFRGSTYASLDERDRARLDDAVITGNVLRQESPADDFSSVYFVFERLNTGSMPLTRHEIRRAVNPGRLRDFIDGAASSGTWERIVARLRNPGGTVAPEQRSRAQEMVLRWLAFWRSRDQYGTLAALPQETSRRESHSVVLFLDRFMARNRDPDHATVSEWRAQFDRVVTAIGSHPQPHGFSPNAAMLEAMLVALTDASAQGVPDEKAVEAFFRLGTDVDFRRLCSEFTSRIDTVRRRHEYASRAITASDEQAGSPE